MSKNRKRKGRPSKAVQRYPSGQPVHSAREPRGETEAQILGTVLAWRSRIVPTSMARKAEAGYELGRMMLSHIVTPRQHRAGYDYARLENDYRMAIDAPSPFPKSMEMGAVKGRPMLSEGRDDFLRRKANEFMQAKTALAGAGGVASREVYQVCVSDRKTESVDNLRIGLNALADFFRIPLDHEG